MLGSGIFDSLLQDYGNSDDALFSSIMDVEERHYEEDDLPFSITEFTVEKRRTDTEDRNDVVYVNFEVEMLDGSAAGTGSCIMTYGLYNEGWILDETVFNEPLQMSPLLGPGRTEEEIISVVQNFYFGRDLSEFGIYRQDVDIENRTATYELTAKLAHKYVDTVFDFTCDYCFDENSFRGWYLEQVFDSEAAASWHIKGGYSYSNSTATTLDIPYDTPVDNMALSTSNGGADIYSLYRTDDYTLKELAASLSPSAADYISSGYSVRLWDGENQNYSQLNYDDFCYFAVRNDYGSDILLIGYDHIAILTYDRSKDPVNHILYLTVAELVPSDTRIYNNLNEHYMLYLRGIAEETGLDPVIQIINERDITIMKRGQPVNVHHYDVEVNANYALGVFYKDFSYEEFQKIQDWQNRTGIQVIYPYVNPDDISGITYMPNFWYKVNERGVVILDDGGNFIPAYSTDTKTEGAPYNSIRISGDDGSLVYSFEANGMVRCRVCFYTYNNIYLGSADEYF